MHGLFENDTMFSVKEKPWHKLGTVVETAPTVQEAIRLAGLDWQVELEKVWSNSGIEMTDYQAVVRQDTHTALGIVGTNYKPLQNTEAFNWFEPFVENGLCSLETAGSLFNGKRVWILAKTQSDAEVVEGDKVESYILLSNSHDGTNAVKVGFTPIRVVCNNTLTCAESNKLSQLIRVKHTQSVVGNLQLVREVMDTVNHQFMATVEQYKELTQRDVSVEDLRKYVKQVFSSQKLEQLITDYESREKAEIEAERKRLLNRIEEFFELEPARKTWNMYNAVNSYLCHERGYTDESRLNSIWFGSNKQLDRKAFELAKNMY